MNAPECPAAMQLEHDIPGDPCADRLASRGMRFATPVPMSCAFSLRVLVALLVVSATAVPARAGVVLDRIKASGQIVIAHRESSVAFSYLDADKKPVGYALDLCDKLADAVRKNDVLLFGLIAGRAEPGKLKVIGKFLTIEPLAIMLSRDDAEFKKTVDDEMKRLIASKDAHAIFDRWFMQPIPPRSTALKLPMNYLLKDFWKYPTDQVPG